MWAPGSAQIISPRNNCWDESNCLEVEETKLEILRKEKKAVINIALNKLGNLSLSHIVDIALRVSKSMTALNLKANGLLMVNDFKRNLILGCNSTAKSKPYITNLNLRADKIFCKVATCTLESYI